MIPTRSVLLLVAAALALASCSKTPPTTTSPWFDKPDTSSSTTTSPTLPTITAPTVGNAEPLVVYLDGWSHRTLAGVNLYVSAGSGDLFPLRFEPATLEDVGGLLGRHPEFVAKVGSRLVNTDFDWSCSEDGCVTAATAFDRASVLRMFSDASHIPGYGESYSAWEVGAGLYKATVSIPAGAEGVDVIGVPADVEQAEINATWSSRAYLEQVESLPLVESGEGNNLLISAGLGRIFTPDPAWASSRSPYNPSAFFGVVLDADVERFTAHDAKVSAAFAAGLADSSAAQELSLLSPNELTYLTSPTIGCAPTVTCVPSTVEVEVSQAATEVFEACLAADLLEFIDSEDPLATDRAPAVYTTSTRNLHLPGPTHLNGVWGGVGPDAFTTPTDPETQLLASPPLASGPVELEVSTLHLYRTTFEFDAPDLWVHVGAVVEVGADAPQSFTADRLLSAVPGLSRCND